jgi:hypothetical protein
MRVKGALRPMRGTLMDESQRLRGASAAGTFAHHVGIHAAAIDVEVALLIHPTANAVLRRLSPHTRARPSSETSPGNVP